MKITLMIGMGSKSSFGDVVDSQHVLLAHQKKEKQKPRETIQVYAERLSALGEDAFEGQRHKRQGHLSKRYRTARADSNSEDDLPFAELREKNRSRQQRVKQEEKQLLDSSESTESYFTGMEDMESSDIPLSLIKSHKSKLL